MRRTYAIMAYVKQQMAESKKNQNKGKLNLTVREEQRNKLEQMASSENRSVSNLIEVMADERWKRLAEQQGIAP
jgi:predicted HicB family RNase H-like nuclease